VRTRLRKVRAERTEVELPVSCRAVAADSRSGMTVCGHTVEIRLEEKVASSIYAHSKQIIQPLLMKAVESDRKCTLPFKSLGSLRNVFIFQRKALFFQ